MTGDSCTKSHDIYLRKVLNSISEIKQPSRLFGLSDYVKLAEGVLIQGVVDLLNEHIEDCSNGVIANSGGGYINDKSSGKQYMLSVSHNISHPKALAIVWTPLRGSSSSSILLDSACFLSSPCAFSSLEVYSPPEIVDYAISSMYLARKLLEEGSDYIFENILSILQNEEISVAKKLYDELRLVVLDKDKREEVWFATLSSEYGFRLADPRVGSKALDAIRKGIGGDSVSPLVVLSQLIETRLPRELLLMNEAAKTEKIVDASIPRSGYAISGHGYTYVMQVLYDSDSFGILKICEKDGVVVLALFPSDSTYVRDLLVEHKAQLGEVAEAIIDPIRAARNLFDSHQSTSESRLNGGQDCSVEYISNLGIYLSRTARIRHPKYD